ncbi:M28 family peptidase [Flavobacteriaceae bacterium]|nr:M28 family peptidase [Flavobacteriaceae bacterium]
MKKFLSFFVLFLVLNSCSNAIVFDQQEIRKQITLEETEFILQTLASDQMKGRDSDSGGYFKAADFVTNYFKENGVLPFYPNYQDSLITQNVVSYNVVGQIGEYNPKRKTVLIGAHLDHVGIKEIEGDSIFNGANDNAAGSTAVMQIARFLAQHNWKQNLIIALLADEEKGLKGAYHLAERMKNEGIDLAYMINFEMIGTTLTTGENQVYLTGYKRSNMADEMNKVSPDFVQFLPQAKELNLFKRSDNYAFYQAFNVPAQTLSSFDFKNFDFYHKAGDEADELNLENMNQIIGTSVFTIANLLQKETKLTSKE